MVSITQTELTTPRNQRTGETIMQQTHASRRQRGRRRKHYRGYLGLAVLALAVILAVTVLVMTVIPLKLTVNGGGEITLEFGSDFQDAGVSVSYGGSAVDAQITASGQIVPEQVGTYTVTYTARYLWKTVTAERTVRIVDTQAPTIVLFYSSNVTLPGQEYVEEGFQATDNYDGDITDQVHRTVKDDVVYYTVTDSSGNTATVTRPIQYGDHTAPDLILKGDQSITISAGKQFTDPGFTAVDNLDGDVSSKVQISGEYDIYTAGTYTITYTVSDTYGNTSQATRTLIVEPVKQPDIVVPDGKVIYLTFDDGPSKHTLRLLEILEKYNVKATFFVVGSAAVGYLDDIVDQGHSIAIHSNTHKYEQIYANDEAFLNDIRTLRQTIYDYTGVDTTLMRFPGGSSNTVSRKYCEGIMTRLTAAVQAQGYQYFDWNVDSGDAGGAKTADEVFNNVIAGVQRQDISIVLQHDLYGYSVDAVERIIVWGLANGYTFLPLEPSSPTYHQRINN